MTRTRAALGRWSAVLLLVSVFAAATVMATWVRAVGPSIPDSADISQAQITAAGTPEHLAARGCGGVLGAVLLTVAGLLVAVALWRASITYRPVVAGYLVIALSVVGIAAVVWFVGDSARQVAAFGPAVDVETDSVRMAVWPWISGVSFVITGMTGIMLVPRSDGPVPIPVGRQAGAAVRS